jgi:hypothetical protein
VERSYEQRVRWYKSRHGVSVVLKKARWSAAIFLVIMEEDQSGEVLHHVA